MSDTIQPVDLQAPLALGEDGIPVVDGSPAIARRLVAQFGTDAADVAQRWAETTDRRYFAVADLIRFGTARDAARGDTMTDPQPTSTTGDDVHDHHT
jgi:hypothetical protein